MLTKATRERAVEMGRKYREGIRHILNPIVPSGGTDDPQYQEAYRRLESELERLRNALEPFAAIANTRGGTDECEKLKALLVYMLELNKPGDGVDLIYQFTTACLNARKALNASQSSAQPSNG